MILQGFFGAIFLKQHSGLRPDWLETLSINLPSLQCKMCLVCLISIYFQSRTDFFFLYKPGFIFLKKVWTSRFKHKKNNFLSEKSV